MHQTYRPYCQIICMADVMMQPYMLHKLNDFSIGIDLADLFSLPLLAKHLPDFGILFPCFLFLLDLQGI